MPRRVGLRGHGLVDEENAVRVEGDVGLDAVIINIPAKGTYVEMWLKGYLHT